MRKIISYILFCITCFLGYFAFVVSSKPSPIPIATVLGAFTLPALTLWWALILYRSKESRINTFSANKVLENLYTALSTKKAVGVGLLIALALVAILIAQTFGKSEIEKCVESGIRAEQSKKPKTATNIWEQLEQESVVETAQEKEHRIRLRCIKAISR